MNWNYQQQKYFLYDPEGDGMDYFDTEKERDEAAKKALDKYLDVDGWDSEIVNVVTGIVTHSAQKTNIQKRPPENEIDDDGVDSEGYYWQTDCKYMCNYEMKLISDE